jgi:hypothetical protein
MTIFQACARSAFFAAALIFQTYGQTTNSALTGQWDFNQGNLKATVGADLQYLSGSGTNNTSFETVVINGANGNVMRFPAADPSQGYLMFHGGKTNGGGTNVNVYTLVFDLLWPAESDGTFRALFNTDTNNQEDAVMFVNPDNAVGVNSDYSGAMLADTWYRLALVFNLTNGTVTKYFNGETNETSVQILGESVVDSRFSLGPALLLFTDNDGDARAGGLVDRIQFYADALTHEQVKSLGSPVGDGGPPVSGDVKIDLIEKVGTNVVIAVSGGGTLQLQRKAKLTDANWQLVDEVAGSGSFTVPATDPTGFFRVQRL